MPPREKSRPGRGNHDRLAQGVAHDRPDALPAPRAAYNKTRDNGVTTMAATATGATTQKDRVKKPHNRQSRRTTSARKSQCRQGTLPPVHPEQADFAYERQREDDQHGKQHDKR